MMRRLARSGLYSVREIIICRRGGRRGDDGGWTRCLNSSRPIQVVDDIDDDDGDDIEDDGVVDPFDVHQVCYTDWMRQGE